jgi:endonuclease YncB( thermonuclease family)
MRAVAAFLIFFATHVGAAELLGRVVHVADGDTITVLDAEHVQHVVRLGGIDAPERGQAFGQVARRNLGQLVHGQQVAVDWHKRDRYGRLVGRVLVDGKDANLAQIEAGLAWHYVAYASEQARDERAIYSAAHRAALTAKLGLWIDREPVPPWEWRRAARLKERSDEGLP